MQMASFGRVREVTKKGVIDLVTEVDVAVERMVRALVAERYPDHDFLGEETGGGDRGHDSRWCWILDPIDGTTNFAHGLPIFSTSLGLEEDGVMRVGAVYDPTRPELFLAERGHGAYLNGDRLEVSGKQTLIDSLLVTGFPYVPDRLEAMVGLFGAFVERSRAVRRLGSAALDVCYVAAGRCEGFWEQGLHAWDIAAAGLIVEEAGGQVSDLDGRPFNARSGRLVASNGHAHDEMIETIRSYAARRARNRTE
jgi:myo-inositol-1(or 4)-monophosphatase